MNEENNSFDNYVLSWSMIIGRSMSTTKNTSNSEESTTVGSILGSDICDKAKQKIIRQKMKYERDVKISKIKEEGETARCLINNLCLLIGNLNK